MKFPTSISAFVILGCLAFSANAQEVVGPAFFNTALQVEPNQKKLKARLSEALMKSGDIELPFIDDFSSDRFPGNEEGLEPLWTSRNATRNFNMGINPPTIGVVTFDGGDEVGYPYQWGQGSGWADTLTSVTIDLTGDASDQIGISFYFQPRGNGIFGPAAIGSAADSLRLEFYAPELDQWFWAWSTFDISSPEAFTFVYIPIPQARFLKEGFRFRFRNLASLQGAFSPWNIDYVRVDRNNINATPVVDDIAFSRQEFTLLKDYTSMPRTHFDLLNNPQDFMRDNVSVELRNLSDINRTLVGNEIRVLHEGNLIASFPNENSPAIQAGSSLSYTHSVGLPPNSFVYDGALSDTILTYQVEIIHAVADLNATSSNDTMRFEQRFFTNYAYDDGSAEWSWANPGLGSQAAMRYTNYLPDMIFGVQIFTMPMALNWENTPFTVKVWEDSGNGPGALIAEAFHIVQYGRDEFQQSMVYLLDEPVELPAGSFYVGYQQSNQTDGLFIGLDRNTNNNPDKLWFMGTSGVWFQSQVQGTVMMQPMFTSTGWEISPTRNRNRPSQELNIYPNPASDFFSTDLPQGPLATLRIYDLSGRLVQSVRTRGGEQVSTHALGDGMYIVHIETENGELYAKKLVVRH